MLEWSLFIAVNGALVVALALNVSRLRIQRRIPHGDGGDRTMQHAIRAHANAVEHGVWMALLLLALSAQPGALAWVAGIGLVYTLARFIHAFGMLGRRFNARRIGAGLTYFAQVMAIAVLLVMLVPGS